MISQSCGWILRQVLKQKYIIILFILTFCVVLPLIFRDDAYSPYSKWLAKNSNLSVRLELYKFINDKQYFNDIRYLATIPKHDREKLSQWDHNSRFKVLITITTTSRRHHGSGLKHAYEPYYLTQVVAQYARLEINRPSGQLTDTVVLVCNVNPGNHTEARVLSSVVDVFHTETYLEDGLNKFEVEKRDYANCLNNSLGRQADYILLVEDDAKPHPDLLENLDHLFKYRVTKLNNIFGYIKLFHPTRLNGFITSSINRLMEWFAIAGLLEHLFTFILYNAQIDYNISWDKRMLRFIYFVLLLLAVGRINVSKVRTISPHLHRLVKAPSCCTPAILFTPTGAQQMANYLCNVTCKSGYAKDSAMDDFPSMTGLKTWFFEPKLFDHIGVYTTRNDKVVDPAIVD